MKNPLISYTLAFSILFFAGISCQTGEYDEADTTATEETSEFPVSTESEAAMTEFKKGLELLEYPDNAKARAYFTKAIEQDSNFVGAYLYRVFTSGSAEEGVVDIKKASGMLDGATEGERLLAALMNTWMTADTKKRMEIANEMVEKFPNVPRSHIVLGNQYLNQKDIAKARASFEAAVKADSSSYFAHNRIGNSYLFDEPKDFDKAASYFQKLVEIDPNNPRGHLALGDSYRAKDQLDKALSSYTKAAEIAPEERLNYQMMGHVNSFLGNYEEARKNYEEAVKHDEDKGANILRFASFVHIHAGNPEAGLNELLDLADNMDNMGIPASRIDQRKQSVLDDSEWIAYHIGATDQLKAIHEKRKPVFKAITADIGTKEAQIYENADILFWETMIALSENDLKRAKEKAEAVKETLSPVENPSNMDGYYFLKGSIAFDEENYEEAISELKKVTPNWLYAHYLLGKAYTKSGQPEAAMDIYTKLAKHNFNGVGYALVRNELQGLVTPF